VSVPCFLLFLCFRKATQEIFSELDETKAKPPTFSVASRSLKMRQRKARGQAHHRAARPAPGPCHLGVRPPGPASDASLPPIYSPRLENLNTRSIFQKHIVVRRLRRPKIGRVQKLFPAPCQRGESPPEVFLKRHACLRSDEWVLYLGLRVHSSS
jgi:hypothetical protein